MLAALVLAAAGCAGGTPVGHYTCCRSLGDIKIDGELDEQSWSKARSSGGFCLLDGLTPSLSRTSAKMVWDDQFLYVAFWCEDRDIYATSRDRDAELFYQDCVQVLVSELDYGLDLFADYTVNPLGTACDVYNVGPYAGLVDWNSPGFRAAAVADGALNDPATPDRGYTVEMAIPLADLAQYRRGRVMLGSGTILRLNLCRVDCDVPDRIGSPGARSKLIVWSPTIDPDLRRTERFGSVVLIDRPAGVLPVR